METSLSSRDEVLEVASNLREDNLPFFFCEVLQMKVAVIAPSKCLEFSELGDLYFVLAQRVLEDVKYAEFFSKKRDKVKMLDNGAFELGKSLETDKLLEVAGVVKPDEIVAPDYPMRGEMSLQMIKDFLGVVPKKMKIVAIPHGRDVLELAENYKKVCKLDVDVVGFSVVFQKQTSLRPVVFHYLKKKKFFDVTKEHHLFGLDSLTELWYYDSQSIRSVDCSLPISCAYSDIDLPMCDFPQSHKRVPDDAELNHLQQHMCNVYIERLLKVARSI